MMTLDQDLVLTADDVLDAEGDANNPCLIEGQGHSLRTATGWQGQFVLRFCTLHNLGTPGDPAVAIDASGAATIVLEGNTFDATGSVQVTAVDDVSVSVLRNTVLEDSLVNVLMDSADNTIDAMLFAGYANTKPKVFQGNHIYKSRVRFDNVQQWLIGGDNPGDGNILIGQRAGFSLRGNDMRVVGNYIRFPGDLNNWNQVKPLEVNATSVVVEHNVIRDGNWLVDVLGSAEIRYNLLGDSHDRPWLIVEQGSGAQKVHHNIFMRNDPSLHTWGAWVLKPQSGDTVEIYNNTFYGGGNCFHGGFPAIGVEMGGFIDSLRSNAFVGFTTDIGGATAIVRGGTAEPYEPKQPAPERLGYADYNLFSNPQAAVRDNYALAVAGKRERMDAGFALNDATASGAVDQQVDPAFVATGMIPVAFPYADDDVKAGTATVCQILAFYRQAFAPKTGSPLLGAGDPADGAGNSIGAIGGADDRFGMLCNPADVGTPNLTAATFVCPKVQPTGTGGTTGTPGGKGFVCVCDVAAGPSPAGLVAFLAGVFVLLRWRARLGRR